MATQISDGDPWPTCRVAFSLPTRPRDCTNQVARRKKLLAHSSMDPLANLATFRLPKSLPTRELGPHRAIMLRSVWWFVNHPLAAGSERSVFFAENGSRMRMCTLMMLFQFLLTYS